MSDGPRMPTRRRSPAVIAAERIIFELYDHAESLLSDIEDGERVETATAALELARDCLRDAANAECGNV